MQLAASLAQAFESEYIALRETFSPGWGGDNYARRLAGWLTTLDRLAEALALSRNQVILELGCGNGMIAKELAIRGQTVYGIDLSKTAITWAIEEFEAAGLRGDFRVGDACEMLLFSDEMFDLQIDGNCFHCIIGSDRARFLSEVLRTMKRGAHFIVSSMCGPPKILSAGLSYDCASRCLIKDGRPWRFMPSPESLAQECKSAGFELLHADLYENSWWDHLVMLLRRPSIANHS